MAHFYRSPLRDQDFLMPVNMADWLEEGHLAYFLIEVVGRLDLATLHARHPNDGVGRPAYDPAMMLTLLVYAYCGGVRSSRRIEASCRTDAAYRVICGGMVPDHSTIARFIVDHQGAMGGLFVSGLRLCAAAGLVDLSVLALDGTKIGSDAALDRNRDAGWIAARVAEALAAIVASEDTEAASPLFAGPRAELATRRGRLALYESALAVIAAEEAAAQAETAGRGDAAHAAAKEGRKLRGRKPKDPAAALERAKADYEVAKARAEERAARRAALEADAQSSGRNLGGFMPGPDTKLAKASEALAAARATAEAAEPPARRTANITDPESRIMKTKDGWVQGYNAQAVVARNGVVVASTVSQDANDVELFVPMLAQVGRTLKAAGIEEVADLILADAGYWSAANATAEGPPRLIATVKDYKQRQAAREAGTTSGEPPEDASALEAMEHRLRTQEGAALYALRSSIVEPLFGDHKENQGWRRFRRRGLVAAEAEWSFMNLVQNLGKLFDHRGALAVPPTR